MATLEELLGATPAPDKGKDVSKPPKKGDIVASDYKRRLEARQSHSAPPTRHCIDPRFGGISGDPDTEKYKRSYGFIEELQEKELGRLKKKLKKTKEVEKRDALRTEINRRQQRIRSDEEKLMEKEIKRQVMKKEKEAVLSGKLPYIPKEREIKKVATMYKASKMTKAQMEKAVKNRSKRIGKRGMPAREKKM